MYLREYLQHMSHWNQKYVDNVYISTVIFCVFDTFYITTVSSKKGSQLINVQANAWLCYYK